MNASHDPSTSWQDRKAALLPWLIDFDQSFALYVANTTKMFVWMIPVLVAVGLAFWNVRRHEP